MAITLEGFDVPSGQPTTSLTFLTTAGGAVDDLICLEFTHRGTGNGTVSDNSGDGVPWTRKGGALYSASAFSIQHYYKRITSAMAGGGITVSVTGLTNSSAGYIIRYRGVATAATQSDPFEAWVAEANKAAGAETHAGVTTVTANAWVALFSGTSPDVAITFTSPLIERVEHLSTGGTDTACAHGSYQKVATGATGTLTYDWATNQVNAAIAYAMTPEPVVELPVPDIVMAPYRRP